MIDYLKKDITTVTSGVIAHGVNCQHAMGSGVALYIKEKWPQIYEAYMSQPMGESMLGTCDVIEINEYLYVANCYTQLMYGYGGGKYASSDAIRTSLVQPFQYAESFGLELFVPRIGCARGGLSWHDDVYPILVELNEKFERVQVYVCDYQPSDENFKLNL